MNVQAFFFILILLLPNSTTNQPSENSGRQPERTIGKRPDAWKEEMLQLVNEIRAEGCTCGHKKMPPASPLSWNKKLEKAAQAHANDMAQKNYLDHRGSNGSTIGNRASRAGYRWRALGENISWGNDSVREAFLGWKDSPAHCQTMMGKFYRDLGAARRGTFWVLMVGSPE